MKCRNDILNMHDFRSIYWSTASCMFMLTEYVYKLNSMAYFELQCFMNTYVTFLYGKHSTGKTTISAFICII